MEPKITVDIINKLKHSGMTYKQIAEQYDTTENYIKMLVYRSRHPEYVVSDRKNREANEKKKRKYTKSQKSIEQNKMAVASRISIPVPDTDLVINNAAGVMRRTVGKIGDDKVGEFINYHMEMLRMKQGVNKEDVDELYIRFGRYLEYCSDHNIMPGNMSACLAIGITKEDITAWIAGRRGTQRHKEFATDFRMFFNSVHEQAPTEGLLNPILAIFWQKAYAGLSDQPQPELDNSSPLGEKQSAEQIAAKYSDVKLPD